MADETSTTPASATEGTTPQSTTSSPSQQAASLFGQKPAETAPATTTEEPKTEETPKGEEPITFESLGKEITEGLDLDNPLANKFLELVNGAETKADLAKGLLDVQKQLSEMNLQRWLDTNREWREAVEKDPVYGGDKLDENLGKVSVLINEFAAKNGGDKIGEEVRQAMDITGAGNNPAIVKFLIWTCSRLSEGAPLSGTPAGGEVSRAQKLYGT